MIGTTSASRVPEVAQGGTWIIFALLILGSAATAGAVIIGNGNPALAVAPIALAVVLAAMWFAPIRVSVLLVVFLSLALDQQYEGPWNSPLAPLGALLATNLNKVLPVGVPVPGVLLLLVYLLLIHIHRSLRGLRTDSIAAAPVARVSVRAMGVSFLAVLALCAIGFQHGGDLQMAKIQVQNFVLTLLLAYLAAVSFRGLRDYRLVGALILSAACIKSVYAIWVSATVVPPYETTNGRLAYATAHGDSMLFACATVLLIAAFFEQPTRKNALLGVFLLPLLVGGMYANNRRLVWVELAAGVATYWIVSRRSKVKRVAVHALLAATPLILVYVAAGWNSQAKVFAPVQLFRSVGDSDVDASTLYRDLENYDLLATMRDSPYIGLGFGHPFSEPVKLPDISFFREYRYMPHNSLLGLWAFCGPLGFSGLWCAIVVAVFLAARSYAHARVPDERVAAFMTVGAVVIFLAQCWGDIGFSERRAIYLVGPALAIAGQLALSTGAWGSHAHAVGRRS